MGLSKDIYGKQIRLKNQKAVEDIWWNKVIQKYVIFLDNVNAHSLVCNPQYRRRKNVESLENFIIERFDLLINNKLEKTT